MDAGVRGPVTVIRAGAGWGKSTLVASWVRQREASQPVGWVTLGAGHNDPRVFWADLLTAVRAGGAVIRGDGTGEDLGRRLASALDLLPKPLVLVLDNHHELVSAAVLDGLARLLHDPPPALRLVLVGRGEPLLPLHRLRAAGELSEIRARHLAFCAGEAAELPELRRLPRGELARLITRTEGWAVGLRLLARATAAGDGREVRDYLLRETVGALPPETQRFLVRTSIAETVCGPLADALTGERNGLATLERLNDADAFVTRIEERPGWYRYHPLLRAALRHQLAVEQPGAEAHLHLMAARWYERERLVTEAMRHAVAAEEWRYLGRLAVDHAMVRILSGERGEFVDLLRLIPAGRHAESPELALCGAVVRYDDGDRPGAAVMLRLTRSLADELAGVADATGVTLRLMEAGIFLWRNGRMPELVEACSHLLEELREFRADQLPSLPHYRAVALNEKGAGLLWTGHSDDADRYLWAAAAAARRVDAPVIEVNALSHLALLSYLRGSPAEARGFVQAAIDLAHEHGFATSSQASMSLLTRALVQLDEGRPVDARESLRLGLHAGGEELAAVPARLAVLVRAKLLLAAGEPDAARATLRQARERAPVSLDAPVLERWLRTIESNTGTVLDHLPAGRPPQQADAPAVTSGAAEAAAQEETLSDRERDVLRYLPTVLTTSEIAGDLFISVNTVKTHMRSIYRKLGAARRREAVVRAQQRGLL
ncbi:hypothetical protein Ade02nite_44720 [Paractinoplanes deccanensis]|uniref:HTH luxR-type domain-containing protein n=2 Tax=Paractinoplanes deccanensis TaxID=113561 RepID=A0ABQ3Y758_9ACTN|nr:hypothetical protein Ade02nite_44720 [Actinoplanes deccanensis]